MTRDLLIAVALAQAVLVAALALLVVGHGALLAGRERRAAARLGRARAALVGHLAGEASGPAEQELGRLPRRLQVRLLVQLAPTLTGERSRALRELAQRAGVIALAARRARSRLWWRRLRGARLLTLLGAGEEVVPALFADPRPEVRAEAAVWAAEHPSPESVARLVALLGDETSLCRFAVEDSLVRLGRRAAPELARYLEDASGPGLEAALRVAATGADAAMGPPALRLAHHESPRVRARAATLLGALGGEEPGDALLALVGDTDADVRARAARALGHTGRRQAAPRLAGLLRDPAWDVRREAGLALRGLGAPGLLLLRRALGDEDRFAADMARQLLDIEAAAQGAT